MVSNCLLVYVPISGLYSLVGVLIWVPLFSIILIGEVGRRLFVSFSFGYIIVAFQKKYIYKTELAFVDEKKKEVFNNFTSDGHIESKIFDKVIQ